jgi:hypothetical protein
MLIKGAIKKFFIKEVITIAFVIFFAIRFAYPDEFTPPYIYEVTPVYGPTQSNNLYYEFDSDEEGTINYYGSCSASGYPDAYLGLNAIYFDALLDGYYDDCVITVTDIYANESDPIYVSAFTVDDTPPTALEVTPIPSVTSDTTPNYTFETDEEGDVYYGGSCASYSFVYAGTANIGNNTITLNELSEGTYSDCAIYIYDFASNEQILNISEFTVALSVPPVLTETYAIYSPNPDVTPWYQFDSTEAGTITYGGSCTSSTTNADAGTNIIIFDELVEGYYDDCTITVTDGDLEVSDPLVISAFTIEETAPYFYFLSVAVLSETNVTVTPYVTVPGTEVGVEYGLTESYGQIQNEQGLFVDWSVPLSLTGLTPNTLYYYRPYVITDEGTFYGSPGTFTTNVPPQIWQVSGIISPNPDTTPVYRFATTEAGTITYGGSCSSSTTNAIVGTNTIIFNELANGTYSNCTIRVADQYGANSNTLTLASFTINSAASFFSSDTATVLSTTSAQISLTSVVPGIEVGVQYGITQAFGQTQNQQGAFLVGNVSLSLSGLTPNIVYYYRPYIITEEGTMYGSIGTFVTSLSSSIWTPRTSGTKSWWSIASSSSGQKVMASTDNEYIYTTIDSGVTWVARTNAGTRNWRRTASSADGSILVAVAQGDYIYRSTDSGATWSALTNAGAGNWWSIATSADGTKIAAAQWGGGLYTSSDSGETWVTRAGAGARYWFSLAMSADGTKIAGVGWQNGRIVTSWDSGATWTERTAAGARNWVTVDMSPDGTKLATVAENANPYTSSDSGATWVERTGAGNRFWGGITLSDDGAVLYATVRGGYIYRSTDSGLTWEQQTATGIRGWLFLDSNSSGNKVVAGHQGGALYTYGGGVSSSTIITEITPVPSITNDATPSYTFTTTIAGAITYGGACSSATTSAVFGVNTISFSTLADGTYSNCTVTVDSSNTLSLSSFRIDTVPPVVSLLGEQEISIVAGGGYEELGAIAVDNIDGALLTTSSGTVGGGAGVYEITYEAEDSAGNTAQVVRTVTVNNPLSPPVTGVVSLPVIIPGLIVQNPIPVPPTPPKPPAEEPKIIIDTPEKPISIDDEEEPVVETPPSLETPQEDPLLPPSEIPFNPPTEQSEPPSRSDASLSDTVINTIQNTSSILSDRITTTFANSVNTLSSLDTSAPALFQTVKTSAVVVGSALAVAPVASSASGLAPLLDLPRLLAHLWNVLLTALGLRKKRKPWGTVYDSQTKQPLDPAYVTLTDMTGKEVASSLTDIDGRYGFVVPPGTYTLSAKKTNYAFPSKKLQGVFEDELYTSLYFGEQVTITEEGEIINKNIPLDQLAFDWNEFAKNEQHRLTYFKKRDVIFGKISQVLFIGGFLFSLIALFATPTFFQILVTLVYVIIFFVRRCDPKLKATGFISKTDGTPLPFAIIRLLSIATGQEIAHKVADKVGRYYAIVPNGTYTVVVDEKTESGAYIKHTLSDTYTVTKGYLSEEVSIKEGLQEREMSAIVA